MQKDLEETKNKVNILETENNAYKGIAVSEKEMKELEKEIDVIAGLLGRTAVDQLGKCNNEFWKSTVEKYGLDISYQRKVKFLTAARAAASGRLKESKKLYGEAISVTASKK